MKPKISTLSKISKTFRSLKFLRQKTTFRRDFSSCYLESSTRPMKNLDLIKKNTSGIAVIMTRDEIKNDNSVDLRSKQQTTFLGVLVESIVMAARIVLIVTVVSFVMIVYFVSRLVWPQIFPGILLKAIEFLGPTFMKLGQWIATRKDLFPEEICNTLSRLQRHTPAHSWIYTKYLLEATYGPEWRQLFVKFDEARPIGSGCCAQVYKAWINRTARICAKETQQLRYFYRILADFLSRQMNGNVIQDSSLYPVAVKVLHPGIENHLKRDLAIMHVLSKYLTWIFPQLKWLNLSECVKEFSRVIENQVNMKLEAENLLKFSNNFRRNQFVIFPRPIMELTTRAILIETFHEGTSISNYINSSDHDLQRRLAKIGITTVLKMIFKDNFVHCDLHPGNILVQENSWLPKYLIPLITIIPHRFISRPRLVILDCGLVASLNDQCKRNLRDVFRSIAKGDGALAGEYIMKHSTHMTPDPVGFKQTMQDIVRRHSKPRFSLDNVDLGALIGEFYGAITRYQVQQDESFINVILSMIVIEGLGRSLDPSNDIMIDLLPFIL